MSERTHSPDAEGAALPLPPPEGLGASDDELIAWARKRGWIVLGVFGFLGVAVTVIFLLVR